MPKYRDYFRKMIQEHETEFAEFKRVHDNYEQDMKEHQEEFNRIGEEVVKIVRDTEARLCGKMEKGDKAVYSSRLADKFWGEVRAFFPLIDYVGAEVS